jgi:hypothetical protein
VWGRLFVFGALVVVIATSASVAPTTTTSTESPPVLKRFLTLDSQPPAQYRAFRHVEAQNDHFDRSAWIDVWTDADASGFTYSVVGSGGSDYIREHVLLPTLDAERRLWPSTSSSRSALTPDNYVFEDRGTERDGLASIGLKPRRKDFLLVDGSIFLRPEDGDLVRLEGRLAKPPSFWTRRVEIVRWFRRIAGVRMPVAVESTASLLVAGRSTFHMTYEYESINHNRVGSPRPSSALSAGSSPGPAASAASAGSNAPTPRP